MEMDSFLLFGHSDVIKSLLGFTRVKVKLYEMENQTQRIYCFIKFFWIIQNFEN